MLSVAVKWPRVEVCIDYREGKEAGRPGGDQLWVFWQAMREAGPYIGGVGA